MFPRCKCVYFYFLVNVELAIGFVLYGMTLSLLDWSSVIAFVTSQTFLVCLFLFVLLLVT